jgi:hypothetical protein
MAINEQWNIKGRAHSCHATGRPFAAGETFVTAIFREELDNLERQDHSLEAWQQRGAEAPVPFSFWRSTYTPPRREEKTNAVGKESAEELLRRLVEEDEPHTENVRFILAVMLERQKLLRLTDQNVIGETKLLLYEHRKTGDVFIVRDPEVPLSQVDSIQAEVVALLETGLPRKAPAETAEPAEPAGAADSIPATLESPDA